MRLPSILCAELWTIRVAILALCAIGDEFENAQLAAGELIYGEVDRVDVVRAIALSSSSRYRVRTF